MWRGDSSDRSSLTLEVLMGPHLARIQMGNKLGSAGKWTQSTHDVPAHALFWDVLVAPRDVLHPVLGCRCSRSTGMSVLELLGLQGWVWVLESLHSTQECPHAGFLCVSPCSSVSLSGRLGREAGGWTFQQPPKLHVQLLGLGEARELPARAGEEAVPEIRQAPCT